MTEKIKLVFLEQPPNVLLNWLREAEQEEDTYKMAYFYKRLLVIEAGREIKSFLVKHRCPTGRQRVEEMKQLVGILEEIEKLPWENVEE